MTDQKCQKWFVKFHAENFGLEISLWTMLSGRPVEIDREQIETRIENNQCYTMWEIDDIVKISKSVKSLVKMKNVSFIL